MNDGFFYDVQNVHFLNKKPPTIPPKTTKNVNLWEKMGSFPLVFPNFSHFPNYFPRPEPLCYKGLPYFLGSWETFFKNFFTFFSFSFFIQKMMMPRNPKNCRKPRPRNPVERVAPLGEPFKIYQ